MQVQTCSPFLLAFLRDRASKILAAESRLTTAVVQPMHCKMDKPQILIIPEYKLLVCAAPSCQHVVWLNQITSHCRGPKHRLKAKEARQIADKHKDDDITVPRSIEVPNFVEYAVSHLPVHTDGLRCDNDADACHYICRSEKVMRIHCRDAHGWSQYPRRGRQTKAKALEAKEEPASMPWISVTCQRFTTSGYGSRYFEVLDSVQNLEAGGSPKGPCGNEGLVALLDRGKNAVKLAEREMRSRIDDGTLDEVNPWLKHTGWTQLLQGLDRKDLLRSIDEPDAEKEPVLQAIWQATSDLAVLMQNTIAFDTGQFVRMEATKAEKYRTHHRPLGPYQDRGSVRKHMRPWMQMLMFFGRTRTPHEWESPEYRFNSKQRLAWTSLWARAAQAVDPKREESVESEGELTELQTAVLRFCIALLNQPARVHERECAMVCALAVLGVDANGWMTPDTYPPLLSSVIKLARFMVVQVAVRDGGPDDSDSSSISSKSTGPELESKLGCIRLVEQMMDKFMIRGTHTPMQWMLDLRAYGMSVHYNGTRDGMVQWEGDRIRYKTMEMTMAELRGTICGVVDRAKGVLVDELLMLRVGEGDRLPPIPWDAMRDNPTMLAAGYSFLEDPRTTGWGVDGRTWLRDRVVASDTLSQRFRSRRQGGVNRAGIAAYLRRVGDFQQHLLFLLHVTGGQPARMPELLSIRHSNTVQGGCRNVFVEGGLVVFVTRYHKGYAMQGDVKIIHRYLPREVGELLVWYLWLVLPYATEMEAGLLGEGEGYGLSMHVWPLEPPGPTGRRWTAERAGRVLRTAFRKGTGQDVGISAYRDVAIAISRRYMRAQTAFQLDEDDEEGGLDEETQMATAMDEQAGHGSHVAGTVYARGIMEQDGAVASKRELFRRASVEWHRFLKFASSAAAAVPRSKRAREEEAAEANDAVTAEWKRRRTVDLGRALATLCGPGAAFRPQQEEAIRAIVDGESPVVAVMATGAGKSLLFMLPAACSPAALTVVVVPLVSLRRDLKGRCSRLGIECAEWDVERGRQPDDASVVLATPESALTGEFATFLNRMRASRRLERIVFDECHLMLDGFRPKMRQLHRLVGFRTQLVFLTATLPVEREAELWSLFAVAPEEVSLFRASTSRGNLRYEVARRARPGEPLMEMVRRLVPRGTRAVDGRTIVYCRTVAEVREVAGRLGCDAYYADAGAAEKKRMLDDFLSTAGAVVAATGALGLGIDVADVRLVVHVGLPWSLLDFAQQSGRAGRDGRPSRAVVAVDEAVIAIDDGADPLVARFVGGDECRRVVLDEHLDGRKGRTECESGEQTCDVCEGGVAEVPQGLRQQLQQRELAVRRVAEREMQAERDLDGLMAQLRKWRHRCVVCHVLDDGSDVHHELYHCDRRGEHKQWAMKTRSGIRFPRYAACYSCALPMQLCPKYDFDPEAGRLAAKRGADCPYRTTMYDVLGGFGADGLGDLRARWKARLESKGVDLDDERAVLGHLQTKMGEHRNESNGLMWEFYWAAKQLL
jgi:superfamily II DNA helicase RecQ